MALDNSRNGRRPHSERLEPVDKEHSKKRFDSENQQKEEEGSHHSRQEETPKKKQKRVTAWNTDPKGEKKEDPKGEESPVDPDAAWIKNTLEAVEKRDVFRVNSPEHAKDQTEKERLTRDTKKKKSVRRYILMAVVEALTLVFIFCVGYIVRYLNMTQDIPFNVESVKNTNLDITKQQQMEGYWTVAVFGVDSRDGGLGKGALADVQIIVNVDMASGDIKMTSVYRDTYLYTGSRYAKINEAYSLGGPENAVAALNKNLDLDIKNYVTFNWKAVIDVIDLLDGVEVDMTDKEFYEMNAYITETGVKSGYTLNPAAYYVTGPGQQHLGGLQAVAYARLRHYDTDFDRTRRQREIIAQMLDKAKKADLATLTEIMNTVLPQISFNIDAGDILNLAKGISRYNIVGSNGFPTELGIQHMGKNKGECVIPTTLASNVTKLHAFLYEDTDYNPSGAVWSYSQKISEDSGYYKTSQEASIAAAREEADRESRAVESSRRAEEAGESESTRATRETETDRFGNVIETTRRRVYETDREGNYIDRNGNVLPTDRYGNVLETTSSSYTMPSLLETDEDGNVISRTTQARESTREVEVIGEAPTRSRESTTARESTATRVPTSSTASTQTTGNPSRTTTALSPGGDSTNQSPVSPTQTTPAPVAPGGDIIEEDDSGNGPGMIAD